MTTFRKVSVLVPTRGRTLWLQELFDSFDKTVTDDSAELIFRIDNDDEVTRDFLFNKRCTIIVGPRMQGYASLPVFFNEMLETSRGDLLMCGNDDMVFQTPGWARKILAVANQYPDGLFDIGVETHNADHFPFSVISKKVAEFLGFIWDPKIFWGDIYLRDVMAHFGRTIRVPDVVIEHRWAGYRPDKVFRESDKNVTARDPQYWTKTHRLAVNAAVERLSGVYA